METNDGAGERRGWALSCIVRRIAATYRIGFGLVMHSLVP